MPTETFYFGTFGAKNQQFFFFPLVGIVLELAEGRRGISLKKEKKSQNPSLFWVLQTVFLQKRPWLCDQPRGFQESQGAQELCNLKTKGDHLRHPLGQGPTLGSHAGTQSTSPIGGSGPLLSFPEPPPHFPS